MAAALPQFFGSARHPCFEVSGDNRIEECIFSGGGGTQLFWGVNGVPRGFQNVGSRERIFLEKMGGGLGNENLKHLDLES